MEILLSLDDAPADSRSTATLIGGIWIGGSDISKRHSSAPCMRDLRTSESSCEYSDDHRRKPKISYIVYVTDQALSVNVCNNHREISGAGSPVCLICDDLASSYITNNTPGSRSLQKPETCLSWKREQA